MYRTHHRWFTAFGKSVVALLIIVLAFTETANLFAQNIVNKKTHAPAAPAKVAAPAATQAPMQQVDGRGAITGIPWAGEFGVQESVSEIMQRTVAERAELEERETEAEVTQPDRSHLHQNPASSKAAQFPATDQSARKSESLIPQTPSTSFTGATLSGLNPTNAFPPDSMGAVGTTQFIVAVNGRIVTFNKATGVADGVLNASTNTFFSSVRNASGSSDPRIRFDRLSNRWFVLMINVTRPNRILLAVSDTATIAASTVWSFFFFQQEQAPPAGDSTCLADYPTLGIDANALYVGVNQFCGSSLAYNGTAAFVIRKSSVLGAGPIVVTAFRNLTGSPGGAGLFTPQGVDNYDAAATVGYFIGTDNFSFGTLVLRRVADPGGTPSLSANIFLTVPATASPMSVRHLGNTGSFNGQLDGLDDRLFAAHLRNGRLWTAHNIGVDNFGSAAGTRTRNGARWYEIANVNTATPTLVQSGTLFASTTTNTVDDRNYWIPSVMVSGQGHLALGCSIAGTNEFANAATAGRLASDPLGTLQAPVALTAASSSYNPPSDSGVRGARRWGDYSYTSLDPCDDMTMWTIQEFCDSSNSYGVRVVKLLAPPPATPVSVNPSTLAAGLASVNVTVSGSQIAGAGFFDPGAGFACRLGATVSGGVIVNSVTYQNPTTVVLNLSTASATSGAKNLTIINPDGQSQTGTGILTVSGGSSCSYAIAPSNQTFTATGGNGSVAVNTTAACPWSAASNDAWISVTSGSSGSGTGTVNFSVAANVTGSPRTGTMTIAGQTFTVNQSNTACAFTLSATSQLFGYPGGASSVAVSAPTGCNWTAASNDTWIAINAGATGSGNGAVNFTVSQNNRSTNRNGTLTIAGQTFTVTQLGSTCVTGLSPTSASYPSSGGLGAVAVTLPIGCTTYTATTTDAWISPVAAGRKVNYTVAANPDTASRSGYIAIGGRVFTVNQAGSIPTCSYAIAPGSQNFAIAGGSGSINVTTTAVCNWTAISNAAFITINSGAAGSGSGSTGFTVAANSGGARSGTITIAGQTFTVTQDGSSGGGCTYTLFPTNATISSSGGSGNFTVATQIGCAWNAVSNAAWLTVTSGASGSGTGTVGYLVAANTVTSPRSATITVAGQTFTINQAAGSPTCSYSVSTTFISFTGVGGNATINVFTAAGCDWTASSPVSWVTLTAGATGSGNGSVTIRVAANPTGATRQTSLTIAGKSVTVKQSR
ncbi:MAG: BACON domain-containing protein [Acidobacteria bacterium]|nr:BACON domain-containing protein [Acidobacteriota bacterium]